MTANQGANAISVLLGDGEGGFHLVPGGGAGADPVAIAICDVNMDGNANLVTANSASDDVAVLLGDGTGSFRGRFPIRHGGRCRAVESHRRTRRC